MLAMSTNHVRRTPPWLCDKRTGAPLPGAPVYFIRPGGAGDRAMFDADLAGPPYNAGRVFDVELFDAMSEAVAEWLSGDDLGRAAEVIGLARAGRLERNTPAAALFIEIEQACLKEPGGWPLYKALVARRARRETFAPFLAAQRFLCGWEGVTTGAGDKATPVPFAAGPDGQASDASLKVIPEMELLFIGREAWGMLRLTDEQIKNSDAPSTSKPAPRTSTSAGATRGSGRGRSTARRTTRTRK